MITGCVQPQMIGPSVGGSERGLETEREIQRRCLACARIQLLKVTSLSCLILPLASSLCFSMLLSAHPDAATKPRATSHCLGEVNSIMSKQLHYINSEEDSCVLGKLFGYGGSFHMNMVSLGGELRLRPC